MSRLVWESLLLCVRVPVVIWHFPKLFNRRKSLDYGEFHSIYPRFGKWIESIQCLPSGWQLQRRRWGVAIACREWRLNDINDFQTKISRRCQLHNEKEDQSSLVLEATRGFFVDYDRFENALFMTWKPMWTAHPVWSALVIYPSWEWSHPGQMKLKAHTEKRQRKIWCLHSFYMENHHRTMPWNWPFFHSNKWLLFLWENK